VLRRLAKPPKIAVLETPAGFEPNSPQVAGKIARFLSHNLQNYRPEVTVVPARKRGTPYSPDDPNIVAPILEADAIFLGPGSPTYAVRQLENSLAWHTLVARHRLGAAVILASAATIAAGVMALPVYEIYKVGEDLHWRDGLDFFGPYGCSLIFIPHWNNTEGGAELDTSRCFMGEARFAQLLDLLPPGITVVGIDEYTALIIEPVAQLCQGIGSGGITLWQDGRERHFTSGQIFPMDELGDVRIPEIPTGLPPSVWQTIVDAQTRTPSTDIPELSPEVVAIVEEREAARSRRDWATADSLRQQLRTLGWQVIDTPDGPQLSPIAIQS